MAELNIGNSSVSDFKNKVSDYTVDSQDTEGITDQDETTYQNTKWSQWHGYYRKIPELKKAIDAYATWAVGKGYTADPQTTVILDNIKGWGEDTFNSIMWNLVVTKKIAGDAFAEIVRGDNKAETLINLKPLDPSTIVVVVDNRGIIKRYEQVSKVKGEKNRKIKPKDMLHLVNDRIADEIHGISVVEACENVILARNEAIDDWRKVLHRNVYPVKIWHLDTDDPAKIDAFKVKVENTVKDKENIFVPKGNVEVEIPTVSANAVLNGQAWIQYLENFFYQALGVPQVILGGSQEFTEASSKIVYLTFQQTWEREQRELEADIWNQLQLRIKINKPASLQNELLTDESKDSGQGMEFQQADFSAGRGR